MAFNSFVTYCLSVGHRHPQKMHISLKTGNVWNSELLPCNYDMTHIIAISTSMVQFSNSEAVPFRLTPNIQHFMTKGGTEGLFTAAMMTLGKAIIESEVRDLLCST
jgi:transformation/transcription domain-associated protein